MKSGSKTLVTVIVVIVALALIIWAFSNYRTSNIQPTASSTPVSWQTYSDTDNNVQFQYPPTFSTNYVRPVDWPPKIQILNQEISCTVAGTPQSRAGATKSVTINGHYYCVTEEDQGAAGSIYRSYAYATMINGKEVILTFSFQFPQCVNYSEPEQSICQSEENAFNIDNTVDQIAQSIQFSTSSTQTVGSSGIFGNVLIGPTCPVETNPPKPGCADKPYQGNFEVLNSNQSVAATFSSDDQGKFKVKVAPGNYSIQLVPSSGLYPRCGTDTITVKANSYTNTTVHCDSGIR